MVSRSVFLMVAAVAALAVIVGLRTGGAEAQTATATTTATPTTSPTATATTTVTTTATATATSTATAAPTATATAAPCPNVTLAVSANATTPTTISVSVTPPVNLRPASAMDPSSFHLHYFIDTDPTPAGGMVPFGNPKVVHTDATSLNIGDLSDGRHTVTVVLGQYNHTACATRGSTTFAIVSDQIAPRPPSTGNGGYATPSSDDPYAAFALLAVAAMLTLTGRLATRRSR